MNKARLLKVARFLDTLTPDKWDFSQYVTAYENGCGTVCCALGWCPTIFPEHWVLDLGRPSLIRGDYGPWNGAQIFFELTGWEVYQLFYGENNEGILPETASASDVAAGIRSFIARKEIQK